MSDTRPTPETDAHVNDSAFVDKNQPHTDWVEAYFARKLERERDEARDQITEKDAQIVALRGALNLFKDWPEGYLARAVDDALSAPPPAAVPLEDVRTIADAVAYTLSHHNEDGEGSIEKLQHTLSALIAKHHL